MRMCETCAHFPAVEALPTCQRGVHMRWYREGGQEEHGDAYYSVPGCLYYVPDPLVLHFEKCPMGGEEAR